MSLVNLNDIVEEDAADLQFPKDRNVFSVTANKNTKYVTQYLKINDKIKHLSKSCENCFGSLEDTHIKCAECNTHLCLECFSKGAEIRNHRNMHSYIIIHDNINIIPNSNWTAKEEKLLLQLIERCGFGNWKDISAKIGTRSANECRDHYLSCYLDGVFKNSLGITLVDYFPQTIPYFCKLKTIDPPRYDINSMSYKNMSEYMAARGDFGIPYDNSAECIFNELSLENWPKKYENISDELHCAMFRAYNHRIAERQRRYEIIKNHGLLIPYKNHAYFQKYSEAVQPFPHLTKNNGVGRFTAFIQLTNGIAFSHLMESMQLYTDYKKIIFKLFDLRKNGITTFRGAKIYYQLKQRRLSMTKNSKIEEHKKFSNYKLLGKSKSEIFLNPQYSVKKRRSPALLDIIEFPGYDKLNEDEKNVCSKVRITPEAYQEYKDVFIKENTRLGSLRLADARRLIKIDVNKIRQIYDFFLEKGYISQFSK